MDPNDSSEEDFESDDFSEHEKNWGKDSCVERWEGDFKWIWSLTELKAENQRLAKKGKDPIIHIKRIPDFTYTFGIRAHKDFGVGLGFRSMIVTWHNEWLPFLLYLIFMLYFWIEVLLICIKAKEYKL